MSIEPKSRSGGRVRQVLARRGALPLVDAAGVVIGVIALVAVVAGSGGGSPSTGPKSTGGASAGLAGTQVAVTEATIDLTRPTVIATVGPNAVRPGAAGDRMKIGKYEVDAPLTFKVVGLDGVMPDPTTPDDVVFYDFSNWPGLGGVPGVAGNAIFSGHVDWGSQHGVGCKNGTVPAPCFAVFDPVRRMSVGDEIEVSVGGKAFKYRVTANQSVSDSSSDWNKILAATAQEQITLITCEGTFDPRTKTYDRRHVVTAVRI